MGRPAATIVVAAPADRRPTSRRWAGADHRADRPALVSWKGPPRGPLEALAAVARPRRSSRPSGLRANKCDTRVSGFWPGSRRGAPARPCAGPGGGTHGREQLRASPILTSPERAAGRGTSIRYAVLVGTVTTSSSGIGRAHAGPPPARRSTSSLVPSRTQRYSPPLAPASASDHKNAPGCPNARPCGRPKFDGTTPTVAVGASGEPGRTNPAWARSRTVLDPGPPASDTPPRSAGSTANGVACPSGAHAEHGAAAIADEQRAVRHRCQVARPLRVPVTNGFARAVGLGFWYTVPSNRLGHVQARRRARTPSTWRSPGPRRTARALPSGRPGNTDTETRLPRRAHCK